MTATRFWLTLGIPIWCLTFSLMLGTILTLAAIVVFMRKLRGMP